VLLSQISGQTVGEVKIVADMHERKAEMARQSDAFIALPGTHLINSLCQETRFYLDAQTHKFYKLFEA